jgi:hypothetical protein
MFGVLSNEKERTADRMDAAKWLADRGYGRAVQALDIDVTRCRFAEFFRALGEPELGALLICETDVDIAATGEGEVTLDRAQTIMRGAPSCTFRYKFAPGA